MRLKRPPPRQHPETIVALIDVVFFLLIFFMLIGRMDATSPFSLTPPTGTTGRDLPGGGLTVAVAADGAIALDGGPVDEAALEQRILARLAQRPDTLVRVNADKGAPLRFVLPLVGRIEAMGARDVVLIVTPNPP